MHMKTSRIAVVAAFLLAVAGTSWASPNQGSGRWGGGPSGRPQPGGPPGGVVVVRPGWGPAWRPGWNAGWNAGWNGGWWGPSVGIGVGGPVFWGGAPVVWGGAWPGVWGPAFPAWQAPVLVNGMPPQQVIIQQAPGAAQAVNPADAGFWYYCTQPAGYFPYVQECSQAWMKVVPQVPGSSTEPPRLAP